MTSLLSVSQLQHEADRCDAEISQCIAELRNGNPDIAGALRGLIDWYTEKRLIKEELSGRTGAGAEANSPGAAGGESGQAADQPSGTEAALEDSAVSRFSR
jgi:hypothetical protein